ncbi:hypothetical protein BH10CYA1_BH10CYA1_56750 [soil metagenome]
MSHQIEQKAERVACDLNQGQMRDAANVLREQVECNPREALAIIQMANQMRDYRSPDHIVVQNGNVFVRDERCHTQIFAGHLGGSRQEYGQQEDCDQRFPNRTNEDWRYQNQNRNEDWRYQNQNCNEDWRYQNPNANPNHGRFDRYGNRQEPCDDDNYRNNRPYQNGNYGDYRGQPDCPPDYRRPDIYQRPIYIPDCYGNGDGYERRGGINAGTAALLVLGGYALSRSIGNHNGGNFSVRARF